MLAAGLVLVSMLVLGIVGTSLGLARALRAEGAATRTARSEAAQRSRAEAAHERAAAAYEEEARQRRRARRAVDDMYTQVAERWLADQPGMQAVQREFLEKVLQYYEEFRLEKGRDPQERYEAAYAYYRVGEIRFRLGQYADAEKAYRQAVSAFEALTVEPGGPRRIPPWASPEPESAGRLTLQLAMTFGRPRRSIAGAWGGAIPGGGIARGGQPLAMVRHRE